MPNTNGEKKQPKKFDNTANAGAPKGSHGKKPRGGKPYPPRNGNNRSDKAPGKNARERNRDQSAPLTGEPEYQPNGKTVPILFEDDFLVFPEDKKKKKELDYVVTQEAIDAILNEKPPVEDDRPRTEVVGIKFNKVGKTYYFAPNGITAKVGDFAIVETARGVEFGQVYLANRMVLSDSIVQPLRPVLRLATDEDVAHNENNVNSGKEAFRICLGKIADHGLDMKLVDAQYTFDNQKLIFYFTSAGRVDFRELVKDLASVFRIRIELRQIGIRDEAKLMGGLGVCGRPLCCASYLSDFVQVSIKMAKEQNLSLNSSKISGACGRLMCCLRYEYETYQREIALMPPVDSIVDTPDGRGTVTEISPIAGTVKVRVADKQDTTVVKQYDRELCKVISQNDDKK